MCGYGAGVSDAVAKKFGAEGFSVGLVARSREKLELGVAALQASGIKAAAFPTDLGDPKAVEALFTKVRASLGPVTVIHWNAYAQGAGDLTKADLAELRTSFDVGVTGLAAAVQAGLSDLKSQERPAVLVTGGGLAFYDAKIDAMAVGWNAMGLAVAKAAQHKLTGLLSAKLAPEGIFVGEVVVLGAVKGTAFDAGHATLESSQIAGRFWEIYQERSTSSVNIG